MTEQSDKLVETVDHLGQIDQLTSRFLVNMAAELRTMDGVFDLMKLEAGCFDLDIQEVELEQLVERVMKAVSDYMRLSYGESERKQGKLVRPKVEYDIPESLPTVKMDGLRIERILVEAILGAVQINRNRKGKIRFSVECNGDWLIFKVSDNGIGLPVSWQDRIPVLPSISQAVVERHGGNLEVKNRTRGGWIITLTFPKVIMITQTLAPR